MSVQRARLTGLGAGTGSVGVALVAGGRWLGWLEIASAGAVLAAVTVVAVLMTWGRTRLAVQLDLPSRRVEVGRPAVAAVRARNLGRRRSAPGWVELPVGVSTARLALPGLPPGAEHEEVVVIPTSRRAVVPVGPARTVRGDPLGLARRQVRWAEPVDLFVHPRTVRLTGASAALLRDLEGQSTREQSDVDLSFHDLREYVPGDDRRAIHWRTTARLGTLMVKRYEDTRRSLTGVALTTDPRDTAAEQELELAVEVTASVGVATLRDERDLVVLAGARRLRSGAPQQLLDDCSGVQATLGSAGAVELGRLLARQAPDVSLAVLVTGSVAADRDLRAVARHLPVGTRTLVVACEPGAVSTVRTHGGVSVCRLGRLADLPRVLTRAVS